MLKDCQAIATIPAKDIASSRRFYEDVLGLRVRAEDDIGGLMFEAGSGSAIYLYETEHAGTAQHTLCSFSSDHVDDDIADLREKGVSFHTYEMPGVEWDGDVAVMGEHEMRGVWFSDPDGNVLALFQMVDVPAMA